MAVTKQLTVRLNVFLLKEEVDIESAMANSTLTGVPCPELAPDARIYTRQMPSAPPSWQKFLKTLTTQPLPRLFNSSASAVVLVPVRKRVVALTFGYGRSMLAPSSFEENFGLIVTLNSVPVDGLKSVDKKELDPLTRHSRINASKSADLRAFGFNPAQDMLRAVTGTPTDKRLGKRLTGMDALSASVEVDSGGLADLLARYVKQYRSDKYKNDFPQIDKVSEVRDKNVVAKLDEVLAEKIRNGEFDKLWMAPSGLIDWSRVATFSYGKQNSDRIEDIHLESFLSTVRDTTKITPQFLRNHYVLAYDDNDVVVDRAMSVYSCIYCEAEMDGCVYLLTDSKWHKIDTDYVTSVNNQVAALVRSSTLPAYKDKGEAPYNKRAAKVKSYALLDAKNINYGGGRSKIEFCDLLSPSLEMIHVKRYGGSSVLSHLFMQGVVSATVLASDVSFKKLVESKIVAQGVSVPWSTVQPLDLSKMTVVYAIVSGSKKPIESSLPFFSKVALISAVNQLSPTRARVVVEKISKA